MNIKTQTEPDMKTGPENAPLQNYIKSYPIIVEIYNQDDQLVRTEPIDYGNFEQKKWLGRLSHWAWELGFTVETRRK